MQPPPLMSFDALKAFIEGHPSFLRYLAPKDTLHRCEELVADYLVDLRGAGAEAVRLETPLHEFMAVRTADRGVAVFDPSFTQFYSDANPPYFLGTAQALHDRLSTTGLDVPLMPKLFPAHAGDAVTAREAFLKPRIYAQLPEDNPTAAAMMGGWQQALAPLGATSQLTRMPRAAVSGLALK